MNHHDHRNLSATSPTEMGGLAVFDGVMMRSRTGFAIATRKSDQTISVLQVPFRAWRERTTKARRLPFLRGLYSIYELMKIGTQALQYTSKKQDSEQKSFEQDDKRSNFLLLLSAIFFIAIFIILPPLLTLMLFGNVDPLLFSLSESLFRLLLVLCYIIAIGFDSEIRTVFQYHGAEHQAVAAFEQRRDVTVSRARAQEVVHPRCGTTLIATVVLLSIPVYALIALWLSTQDIPQSTITYRLYSFGIHLLALPLLIGGSFEALRRAAKSQTKRWARILLTPGLLMQRLTTRTPNDHQREVAIVALYAATSIPASQREIRRYRVKGLEDDDSAPGYTPFSPARPAPPIEVLEGTSTDEPERRPTGEHPREA